VVLQSASGTPASAQHSQCCFLQESSTLLRRLHALRVDFKACFWISIYEPAAPATTLRPTRAVAVPLASFHFSRKARSNPAATHASAIGQSGKEVAVDRKPRGVSQSTGPCVSPAHPEKARPAAPASAVAIPIRLSDLKTRMTSRSRHGALHTNAMQTTMLSMNSHTRNAAASLG
jgi:hypothetical protein